VLGKDALIEEFGGVIRPVNLQNPAILFLQGIRRSDFGGRNDEERLEVGIERPDLLCADKKLNRRWRGIAQMILSAVYDDQSAKFARFVVGKIVRLGGRQQDGRKKHAKTGDGSEPAIPKTERQDDKRGACEPQENAEGHPGLSVAADVEKFGNKKNYGKHGTDHQVA
jgi:hypothetical protein